jgi:hypothetical protein
VTSLAPALPDDPSTLKAMLLEERAESERLRQIIKALQRHRFGRRAESLPEDQLLLGLEEAEQLEAAGHAQAEEAAPAEKAARSAKRRVNRGSLGTIRNFVWVGHERDEGAQPCPNANSLVFLMPSWTSSWLGPIRKRPLIRTVCWTI